MFHNGAPATQRPRSPPGAIVAATGGVARYGHPGGAGRVQPVRLEGEGVFARPVEGAGGAAGGRTVGPGGRADGGIRPPAVRRAHRLEIADGRGGLPRPGVAGIPEIAALGLARWLDPLEGLVLAWTATPQPCGQGRTISAAPRPAARPGTPRPPA